MRLRTYLTDAFMSYQSKLQVHDLGQNGMDRPSACDFSWSEPWPRTDIQLFKYLITRLIRNIFFCLTSSFFNKLSCFRAYVREGRSGRYNHAWLGNESGGKKIMCALVSDLSHVCKLSLRCSRKHTPGNLDPCTMDIVTVDGVSSDASADVDV